MKNMLSAVLLLCTGMCAAQSQRVPFWGAKAPLPFETPSKDLKPGEFTWQPDIAPQGPILVVVSLDEQRAYTYRNGIQIGESTISSGKAGHLTPTGVFITLQKDANHHSSKYNDAAMPYQQRLTYDGVALHAGGLPGYPSSHGCIHLPSEFARLLFQASPLGMTVVVTTSKTAPTEINHPAFLTPVNQKGKADEEPRLMANQAYRWQPELSPDGPLSIVLSRVDQRIIVMRNGIEIGRSKITIQNPKDSIGTHVLIAHEPPKTAVNAQDGKAVREWIALSFSSLNYEKDRFENPLNDKRISIPKEFMAVLIPLITAGTSVVVTDAPILENTTTGVPLTVLTSSPEGS